MKYEDFLLTYEKATINDFVKRLYQKHMGPAHLVDSIEKAITRIKQECSEIIEDGFIHVEFEYLSEALYRMHFVDQSDHSISVKTAAQLFVLSSTYQGDEKALVDELATMQFVGDDQLFVDQYLLDVKAISHSVEYREAYQPRYRVIKREYAKFIELLEAIDDTQRPTVINIDGNSGSGKSTLASMLNDIYECDIIHADDFFLQDNQRTESRLSEVGGNIDYERMKSEVINNLRSIFTYQKYDCMTKDFSEPIGVNNELVIIEGSYSSHQYFGDYSDIRVFLSIDKERQYARIKARNGEKIFPRFKNEWIPKEDDYFEKFEIMDKSDFTFFI